MASITDLDVTDNMASSKQPFLDDLRESIASIETHINDKLADNLVQLSKDAYGTGYAFDNDAAAQYVFNLYDKNTSVDSYTGGNFTLSTTGAWTDVDATNVSVANTPEVSGDFKTTFSFSLQSVTSNATNEVDIRFRLTDGSTQSTQLPRVKHVTGVTGTTNTVPVVLSYTFDAWSAALKTVKLQYFLSTLTATTLTLLANSNDPVMMEVEKV